MDDRHEIAFIVNPRSIATKPRCSGPRLPLAALGSDESHAAGGLLRKRRKAAGFVTRPCRAVDRLPLGHPFVAVFILGFLKGLLGGRR